MARNLVGNGKKQKPGDFGFDEADDYVRLMAPLVYMSNFAAWPEAGGLNNQDEAFVKDMTVWLMGLANEVRKQRPPEPNPVKLPKWDDGLQDMPVTDPVPNWMEYA